MTIPCFIMMFIKKINLFGVNFVFQTRVEVVEKIGLIIHAYMSKNMVFEPFLITIEN